MSEKPITGQYGFSRSALEARRLSLVSNLKRYTCFVALSKYSLLLLLCALFATIILLPIMKKDQAGVRVAFSSVEQSTTSIDKPYMKNPKFQGVDEQLQPYVVTADMAIQQDEKTIEMQHVQADMTYKDGAWLMLNAGRGVLTMDADAKKHDHLVLDGDVSIFQDQGYEVHVPKVNVFIAKGYAVSEGMVSGQSPMGSITAGRLQAWHKEKRMVLDGRVKVVFNPQAAKQAKQKQGKDS